MGAMKGAMKGGANPAMMQMFAQRMMASGGSANFFQALIAKTDKGEWGKKDNDWKGKDWKKDGWDDKDWKGRGWGGGWKDKDKDGDGDDDDDWGGRGRRRRR